MTAVAIFVAIIVAGYAFLRLGPKSWRTVIMHAAIIIFAGGGEILNALGALNWDTWFEHGVAAAIAGGISILGILYRIDTTGPVGGK